MASWVSSRTTNVHFKSRRVALKPSKLALHHDTLDILGHCTHNRHRKNFTGLAYLVQKPNCTKDIPYYGGLTGDDADYSCSLAVFNMSGYAEQDFPPIIPHTKYTRTCTGNSLVTKSMTLTTFITNDDGSVTIRLLNPSPNDEYGFQLDAVKRDGKWHTCESSKGLPWQLESCEYLLEAGGSDVGFKLEWFCDDLDPYHA